MLLSECDEELIFELSLVEISAFVRYNRNELREMKHKIENQDMHNSNPSFYVVSTDIKLFCQIVLNAQCLADSVGRTRNS